MWLSVDPLAENAHGWTPYRYGFNNPIFYSDPSGLFEDEDAAKAYAKANGIKTGLFRDNKIVKHDDGNYAIENRSARSFTINDKEFGLMSGPIVEGRGLHLRDIGIDGWNERCNPYSESYNPNATLKMNLLDRLYFLGHQLGLALPSAKLASVAESGFSVAASKFDYFLGRVVTGNAHNIARSSQNLNDLTKMGINTESQLIDIFNQALTSGKVISEKVTEYGTTVMKSVLVGDKGSVGVGFFYKGGNMSAKPTITTIIPKTW